MSRALNILAVIVCGFLAAGGSTSPENTTKAGPGTGDHIDDVYAKFKSPPHGYGEVAFYWWVGDTLTRERILWQLDQLQGKGVVGLQVNYAHTDSGGLLWGLSMPSQPKLFSEEWWELFGWFMQEAKKRGMSISVSDYTLGVGQGSYVDDALATHPELAGSELKHEKRFVTGGAPFSWALNGDPLCISAYRAGEDSLPVPGTQTDLLQSTKGRTLYWTPPGGSWLVMCVWAERVVPSYDPMNARSGSAYIDNFFERFARRFPEEPGKGLNYFFSDELWFRLQYSMWNDAFADEFTKRKGYDIRPYLSALFVDTGPETPRIRLDYNDVVVALSEENFFRPLYQWHERHGMTFGCDHGGRGKDVAEFGDYFRTQRWNQGPGCDQPLLQQDIVKNKVASSIAHLYRRPRVWLEGFHSSGWGTSSADVADATFGNFVMGQNLLTLHGLYYTTHGGWWEWAPPCNHFRMPYWQHIDPFLAAVQRLSYLLSQGDHRCDVAVLYPVEPVVAGAGGQEAVSAAFAAAEALYNAGIDFDFMDFESLARSTIEEGRIRVSGEEYRVLVIPSMKVIRSTSLAKARDLIVSGGVVVNIGSIPDASEKGRGDKEFGAIRAELFGEVSVQSGAVRLNSRGGALYQSRADGSLNRLVDGLFARDFEIVASPAGTEKTLPRVMHRRIAGSEVYAVYNLPAGTECCFRSKGRVELWDPWTGERRSLYQIHPSTDGTVVRLPLSQREVQLIVFHPGGPETVVESTTLSSIDSIKMMNGKLTLWGESSKAGRPEATVRYGGTSHLLAGESLSGRQIKPLTGEWGFEVRPVLDNRWGDFHWPPTHELIGSEVRRLSYSERSSSGARVKKPSGWAHRDTASCSYGPQFWKLGPLPAIIHQVVQMPAEKFDPTRPVMFRGREFTWEPYEFSWRWGVEDDPGRQGYHGLKEEVHDSFIRLGRLTKDWTTTKREHEEGGSYYFLLTGVVAPKDGEYEIEQGVTRPVTIRINGEPVDPAERRVWLHAGVNTLQLWYNKPVITYFVIRGTGGSSTRGLWPEYPGKPLAMRWYVDASVLPFDARFREGAPEGLYKFTSPPGMMRMRFTAHGDVEVSVGGKKVSVSKGAARGDGAADYVVELGTIVPRSVGVEIRVWQKRGYYGGAAIPEPIRLDCGKGIAEPGDWSRNDALYAYSGGVRYSKSVLLSAGEAKRKVELDLGSVVSTAEVWVNGVHAGLRVSPPWVFDVSRAVREGDNTIEVLVYNTAANHYTSIPTRYRGSITSGILGPAAIVLTDRVVLTGR